MPTDHEPRDLTDLPLQPTGSGVADTDMALLQAEIADADADPADDDRPTRTQA